MGEEKKRSVEVSKGIEKKEVPLECLYYTSIWGVRRSEGVERWKRESFRSFSHSSHGMIAKKRFAPFPAAAAGKPVEQSRHGKKHRIESPTRLFARVLRRC